MELHLQTLNKQLLRVGGEAYSFDSLKFINAIPLTTKLHASGRNGQPREEKVIVSTIGPQIRTLLFVSVLTRISFLLTNRARKTDGADLNMH